MSPEHDTSTGPWRDTDGIRRGWVSACICGWVAGPCRHRSEVTRQATAHLDHHAVPAERRCRAPVSHHTPRGQPCPLCSHQEALPGLEVLP